MTRWIATVGLVLAGLAGACAAEPGPAPEHDAVVASANTVTCLRDTSRDAQCFVYASDHGTDVLPNTLNAWTCTPTTIVHGRPANGYGCGDPNVTADPNLLWVCCP